MNMEKGVLPGVYYFSLMAALATAVVCSLVKLSFLTRCCSTSCTANTCVGLHDCKRIILRRNFRHPDVVRHPGHLKRNNNAYRGVSLIEVLVTLVVLSVGLLGMAVMQVRAMQINQSAYMRTHAVSLSQDMADRMRINWQAAKDGNYEVRLTDSPDSIYATNNASDQLKLANKDIREWLEFIQASLPQGDGVVIPKGDRFTITLCWDDNRDRGKPDPNVTCGADGLESNVIEVAL